MELFGTTIRDNLFVMTTIWFAVVLLIAAGSTFVCVAAVGLRRQIAHLQQLATQMGPLLVTKQQQNEIQTAAAQLGRFPVS